MEVCLPGSCQKSKEDVKATSNPNLRRARKDVLTLQAEECKMVLPNAVSRGHKRIKQVKKIPKRYTHIYHTDWVALRGQG